MSDGIRNRIGPYLHADGALAEKAFAGGREFKVVIAGAYDAGIIGSEHNGIVVLDETYGNVVLDQHMREGSGYHGPSARQRAEFDRILAMGWAEFSRFCREHPRYREGSMPDAHKAEPNRVRPEADRIVFPASAKDPDCPYAFPLEGRREIVQFLASHPMHDLGGSRSPWAFAWDIKVHSFDRSGRDADHPADRAFDARWEAYLDEHGDDLFDQEAEDALSQYVDGEYTTYPGDDQGSYRFATAGRSGGWLVLTGWDGPGARRGDANLGWESQADLRTWLNDLSDEDLVRLYKLVVHVDKDVDAKKEMEYRFAEQRAALERGWKAAAERRADADGVAYTVARWSDLDKYAKLAAVGIDGQPGVDKIDYAVRCGAEHYVVTTAPLADDIDEALVLDADMPPIRRSTSDAGAGFLYGPAFDEARFRALLGATAADAAPSGPRV